MYPANPGAGRHLRRGSRRSRSTASPTTRSPHRRRPNVLVAMNPAALKSCRKPQPGGTVIVNVDTFDERNLAKAGYDENPLTDGSLKGPTRSSRVPMTSITKQACEPLGV
ncbi:MAG: 2-oxoacid:acceptor oxidoreductase family protein [Acidimicrobiales bacterium]